LNEISAEAEARARIEEGGGEEEDGEDILGTKDKDSSEGGANGSLVNGTGATAEQRTRSDPNSTAYPQTTSPQGPDTDTSHTLRHRHHPSSSSTRHPQPTATATTTGSSLPTQTQPTTNPKTQNTESSLTQHRLEQETLTTSLLTLASQLKSSSQNFQSSLESEKTVLDRAVEGLDRNTTGMEAAGKRMGMLRKMSEGKGWWGRMMIYLWIFGLWFVAIGIVYLGPKLRF
jgi:hypothetical protein